MITIIIFTVFFPSVNLQQINFFSVHTCIANSDYNDDEKMYTKLYSIVLKKMPRKIHKIFLWPRNIIFNFYCHIKYTTVP